jgi:polyphosphate kinase
MKRMTTRKKTGTKLPALLDRDHSLVAFNERVFSWAVRDDVPLLERLRFLCIVSSNLDEFFEVRMAPHLSDYLGEAKSKIGEVLDYRNISNSVQALVAAQYTLFNEVLLPKLQKQHVHIIPHSRRTAAQRKWVATYFQNEVKPLVIPISLDPSHPFPQVASKTLNFVVRLSGSDAFGRSNEIAIVKIPRSLPRFIQIPGIKGRKALNFVSISSLIRSHLGDLFPGRTVTEFSQFRVTRHSDVAVDEDEVKNLRTALRQSLQHRSYGRPTRLEVSHGCSEFLSNTLLQEFNLPEASLYRVQGPVNLVRMAQLIDMLPSASLLYPKFSPAYPKALKNGESLITKLQASNMLLHHPFESFDTVLDLLREAVLDPQVLAIKQTVYRAGANSELIGLLREAVRRGKEVTVVVELKARFDEQANIGYSETLENVGAQVVYGVVGLKTHAKLMLITRRESSGLKQYAHLSTGNYNPSTARLYTDWGFMTSDEAITADVEQIFVHLASQNKLPKLNKLLMAPFHLQDAIVSKIQQLEADAARGKDARLLCKMNSLTDVRIARSLLLAAKAGVQIDLIVRGACILPVNGSDKEGNIRVRSVIGRFLEHTRVFYFKSPSIDELWLSSADFMSRNMLRRIEIAWPVEDQNLKNRILEEGLAVYLRDTENAWQLESDGRYRSLSEGDSLSAKDLNKRIAFDAHRELMTRYGANNITKPPAP